MAVLDQSAAADAEAPLGGSEGLNVSSGWRWCLVLTQSETRTHTQTHTECDATSCHSNADTERKTEGNIQEEIQLSVGSTLASVSFRWSPDSLLLLSFQTFVLCFC